MLSSNARRASAPSALNSISNVKTDNEVRKTWDTSPEEPHIDDDKNQDQDEKMNLHDIHVEITSDNNQDDEHDDDCLASPQDEIVAENDIHLSLDTPLPKIGAPLGTSWIVSWDKLAIWPQQLSDISPPFFHERRRQYGHDNSEVENRNRENLINSRRDRAREHNQHIFLTIQRRQDAAIATSKTKAEKLQDKLERAADRRELWLANHSSPLISDYIHANKTPIESESGWEVYQRRQADATAQREIILLDRQERAGFTAARAKAIAEEISELHGKYEELALQVLKDRLARAEVRRLILLDKRRLIAGRHGNYVKSVYLTNRYMERREAERLEMMHEAAIARHDEHIESIQSRARRHNLSVQFRASCAFRLFDAQWLNQALRNSSAQQAADIRRDQVLQTKLAALEAASAHRHHVLVSRHRQINARSRSISIALEERLGLADRRRQSILHARKQAIVDRWMVLRSRKLYAAHQQKTQAKRAAHDKVEQATKRRESLLERRRSIAATRNWYAKILAQRHAEANHEASQLALHQYSEKIRIAAERRFEYIRPLFSELVDLRGKRVGHVLQSHEQLVSRVYTHKAALAAVRLAEIDHGRARARHATWLHTQQVRERREHDLVFRQQCIASHAFARLRSAEIRRALAQDAVRAAAEEDQVRGEAARLRIRIRNDEKNAFLQFRLIRAEEKRAARQADRISAAIWFDRQGHLVRNRLRLKKDILLASSEQAVREASLRKAIGLTLKARKYFVERAVVATRKNCMRIAQREINSVRSTKHEQAEARRLDLLAEKKQTARRTLDRVKLSRLERQSTDIVDAAIKTAMNSAVALQAEARRVEIIQAKQRGARERLQHVNFISKTLKAKWRLASSLKREESNAREEETTRRREEILMARKLGQRTNDRLQPYASLTIVGKAAKLWPNEAA